MLPQEIIRKKRDKKALNTVDIHSFIEGITKETVSDAQIAAFCMAVFINKLNLEERVALTQAMAQSGHIIDWKNESLNGPVIDKHSSGGVGDKVSLILAPVIAACGGYVPMISGRGLGHTGGTLDKMDAIPGYNTSPDIDTLKKVVRDTGCAIIGQTPQIAPADKRMYAVRDISGSVETLDLITPSILSKKMAAGLDALVMDIKWGNGAFMSTLDEANELAQSIGLVANKGGLPTEAVITDMNQTLGQCAGNALEVKEAISFLKGDIQEPRLNEIVVTLCVRMLLLSGLETDEKAAETKIIRTLENGNALECFARMVTVLGGPADLVDHTEKYFPAAPVIKPVPSLHKGMITATQTRDIGLILIELGAGRRQTSDALDYRVGLEHIASVGQEIEKGQSLCMLHAKNEADWHHACEALQKAFVIEKTTAFEPMPVIQAIKTVEDFHG